MSRKLYLAALLVLVVAASGLGVAGASGGHASRTAQKQQPKAPCSPPKSGSLYRDSAVRVYVKYSYGADTDNTYACLLSASKRRLLATCAVEPSAGFCDLVYDISAKAPWIGYRIDVSSKVEGQYTIVCAHNLRTNQHRCAYADLTVLGLGYTRSGSLAWMDSGNSDYSVHKLDAGAKDPVLLDSGADIDPTSFAVGGTHIYWTKAGAAAVCVDAVRSRALMLRCLGNRSRSLVVVVGLSILVTLSVEGPGSEAVQRTHKRPSCSMPQTRTVYEDPAVRVYIKSYSDNTESTFACFFPAKKRRRLAYCDKDYESGGHCESVQMLSVKRPWIAYAIRVIAKYESYAMPCVLNLRTGATQCPEISTAILGVGLTHKGSLAWIAASDTDCCFVQKLDAGTTNIVALDSGTDIDPTSFAVGGKHIYWTKAGTPQSAPMP